jgi:RIO1 family
MGLVHGDGNRFNLIVDRSSGHVWMIDFEHAEEFDEEQARLELESLTSQLLDGTGRGGPACERSQLQNEGRLALGSSVCGRQE